MRAESPRRSSVLSATTVAAVTSVLIFQAGGLAGWAYALLYLSVAGSALPFGWTLMGRRHPAGWIMGGLLGYAVFATACWMLAVAGWWTWWASTLTLLAIGTCSLLLWRRTHRPVVRLPVWSGRTSQALAAVLVLALLVMSLPYIRAGERDAEGNLRYRAYFTADFVWHEALTAELAKGDVPPRNPYAAAEPLAYYWTYFVVPATAVRALTATGDAAAPIGAFLKTNGILSGLLFVSAVFLACWTAVPRAGAAGLATGLTMVAASAEGLYAAYDTWRHAESLAPLRDVNVDAVTLWWFDGLTFDGLPRALWYNPQHSMACALGLIALVIASRLRHVSRPAAAGLMIGLCLALGLLVSPFPAGALALVVAARLGWGLISHPSRWSRPVLAGVAASMPLAAGVWWCVSSGMVAGAGANVSIGWSARAAHRALTVLGLAAGPLLLTSTFGIMWAAARGRLTMIAGSVLGAAVALCLYFFVTLDAEPVWIGWRAGQVLMVTAPGALAFFLVRLRRTLPHLAWAAVVALWMVIGVPTTVIDWYNAQDTSNVEMGPGFRWTVRIAPSEQAAFDWIRRETAPTAVIQASLEPRGRETWSLVPSFAHRRMAAGLPISLMVDDHTREQAATADRIFQSHDAVAAWLRARKLSIDFLFLGHLEQETYPDLFGVLDSRPDLFRNVFSKGGVSIFAVLCQVPSSCK